MALLLKTIFRGYFYLMNDVADPRAEELFLMSSPLPTIAIIAAWFLFVFKWGPAYMKNREPLNLKYVMIAYNGVQVIANLYLLYNIWLAGEVVDWKCAEVDYSRSYWGLIFLKCTHFYFLLKMADLLDTVFFVLRKKSSHLSFLHIYHHFGMAATSWVATKFVGGGHIYFVGLANCIVHTILYCYYLATAYDTKYSKLLWLKKFITQAQLFQFVFLCIMFGQLLFRANCQFPKIATLFMIPQDFFMIVLFSDFYIRTYYLEPRKKKKELEAKRKLKHLQERIEDVQEKKDS